MVAMGILVDLEQPQPPGYEPKLIGGLDPSNRLEYNT
jgi:hypothetical protein